jgi:hypothetical protein
MISVWYLDSSTNKYNITSMLKNVDWSGDINTYPRTLQVNVQNANNLTKGKLISFKPGRTVILYIDGVEKFRGYVFKTSINEKGEQSLTCYDNLIYLTKNSETMIIKNQSASDVISSLCKKFGVPVGSIEATGYKIKKMVCQGKALSDIFSDSLKVTKTGNGKLYLLRSEKGKAYLKSRKNAAHITVSVTNIISGNYEVSIEELKNQVKVEKGQIDSKEKDSKYSSVTEKDSSSIDTYGIMQQIESADDKDTISMMSSKAKKLLKQLKEPTKTYSVDFIGHPDCITGNKISIKNEILGFSGTYYITADSHSFDGGVHKMSLQLSTNINIDDEN